MDNTTLGIYIHELRNQVQYTEGGFELFNQALQNNHTVGVLYAAQNILSAISNVSSMLWPTRARDRARGEALRKVLDLAEKHPLNDRRLSELLDNSDQKLDEWIEKTRGQKIVIDFIGPLSRLPEEEKLPDANFYRAYDPETKVFYYRGAGYNLEAIAKTLGDVGSRILQVHQKLFPEQAEASRKAAEQAQAAAAAAQTSADDVPKEAAPEKKPAAKKPAAKKKAAPKKAAPKKAGKKKTD